MDEFARNRLVNDPSCYARAAPVVFVYNYDKELSRIRYPALIIVATRT